MMRKYLLVVCFLIPFMSMGQEKETSKYLGDIIPVVDGKVVFAKELKAPGLTDEQIYNTLLSWAESRFTTTKNNWGAVVYTDEEKKQIACKGGEYLTFAAKALSLDRAGINYRVVIACAPGKCNMEIAGIQYLYPESDPKKITAEEWITDENAMNKKKTKFYPGMGKFRIHTVDLVEELFADAQRALNDNQNISTLSPPAPTVKSEEIAIPLSEDSKPIAIKAETINGYKQISPDNIPGNIIKLLTDSWSLITTGNEEEMNMMTASWGGIGCLYGKPVSFCFINPARYTYQLMEKEDYYTISFYTEAYREALNYNGKNSGRDGDKVAASGLTPITLPSGTKAFSEAWMIFECKKMVSQPILQEGIAYEKLKENWEGKPMHKMYIGEIINVWVK